MIKASYAAAASKVRCNTSVPRTPKVKLTDDIPHMWSMGALASTTSPMRRSTASRKATRAGDQRGIRQALASVGVDDGESVGIKGGGLPDLAGQAHPPARDRARLAPRGLAEARADHAAARQVSHLPRGFIVYPSSLGGRLAFSGA
ncbi:hypothetical protein BN13_1870008 [Nostocoides jenkinsii Ben 74]|uniref:Uncharacterized protein n=1 Tax=Nostocoides jenkinsii Ben 74 TaxID=1193518 RepID=A0A077M5K9_9MICO|nr:hypothetical protein BN13_1330007 [Tetrasphaera jenkinsii Ben 74]CCI52576.1 hypothetical protein BN13_1870008 [Tetrasphaera jenkinsii Ben 74]